MDKRIIRAMGIVLNKGNSTKGFNSIDYQYKDYLMYVVRKDSLMLMVTITNNGAMGGVTYFFKDMADFRKCVSKGEIRQG